MKTKILLLLLVVCFGGKVFTQNSPYINRVVDYRPAPGQHINRLFPSPQMSDTYEKALKFAEQQLLSQDHTKLLGLGAYGGYVIVAFDHSVVNVKGEYDLRTTGNNFFYNNTTQTAMAEPGIVMVCQDLNKNGIPDPEEPWYELAGSEYNNPKTIHNYEVTYYRPDPDMQKSDIRWTDNQGQEGVIKHISFAYQKTMYPLWIKENTMTFKGTKLPGNIFKNDEGFTQQIAFDWGYADNNVNIFNPDTKTFEEPIEKTGLKIDWAVDDKGNPVDLEYIDFVKIYTGQLQQAGILGETSTELSGMGGIIDLHPNATVSSIGEIATNQIDMYISNRQLIIVGLNNNIKKIEIFSTSGVLMSTSSQLDGLPSGIYIVRIQSNKGKVYNKKVHIK